MTLNDAQIKVMHDELKNFGYTDLTLVEVTQYAREIEAGAEQTGGVISEFLASWIEMFLAGWIEAVKKIQEKAST